VMRESGFASVSCTSYLDLFHYYIGHKPTETECTPP